MAWLLAHILSLSFTAGQNQSQLSTRPSSPSLSAVAEVERLRTCGERDSSFNVLLSLKVVIKNDGKRPIAVLSESPVVAGVQVARTVADLEAGRYEKELGFDDFREWALKTPWKDVVTIPPSSGHTVHLIAIVTAKRPGVASGEVGPGPHYVRPFFRVKGGDPGASAGFEWILFFSTPLLVDIPSDSATKSCDEA